MGKFSVIFGVFVLFVTILRTSGQSCSATCQPPSCSCPRFSYPMDRKDIPQMVYFGFDDAVNVVMSGLYNRIFTEKRKNPNGCRVKMTLFISHQYTEYERVKKFYESGHEIAVHSVTHKSIDNDDILRREAKKQKENLVKLAGVPAEEIIGWRSPFLKTAGNNQPEILKELGYEYDISMTYSRQSADIPKPWPFTMDNGWPYKCGIQPCPTQARTSNFWAVPVVSLMDHENKYPCSFVDGCTMRANNEEEAFKYLMENFMTYYNTTRTPFGLNMHAAWFYTRYNLKAMNRFLDELHKMDDVYVVSVKQMLDWMKEPTPLSEIHTLKSWGCPEAHQVVAEHKPSPIVRPTPMGKPVQPASRGSTAHVIPNTWITERRIQSRTGRPVVVPRWHFINTNPPTPRPTTTTTTTTTTPTTTTTTPTTTTPTTTTTTPTTTTTTPTTTTTTPTTTTTTPTTTTTTPTTTTTTPTTTTTTPTTTTTTPTTTTTTPTTTTTTPSTTTSKTTTSTTSVTTPSTPSRSQIANNDDITSSRNNVRTIERPSVWNSGSPTSRIIPSPNSIDANDRFLDIMSVTPPNNTPRRWWAFWRPSTSSRPKGCVQGVSCKLPNCFCEGTKIPGNLNLKDTPQLIYITIDGSINAALYRRYRQLVFKRRNPNGCVIRGTIYASERGSFERITRRLSKVGAEIAMSGVNEHSYTSSDQMEDEIVTQMTSLEKSNVTSVGWKTPELKALGDEQFRLLKKYGFKYDATLTATHPERGGYKPWPFTLDYGYKADCVIPECPTKSFPGLWELPATALLDYKKMFGCNYADGCMLNPPTSKTTESYLWDNFMYNYETNKAPLGLHLRQVWFRHPAYADNIKGLQAFIKRVLTLKDVYIVSGQDVITWMENPVKVKDITDTVPWQCKS